MALSPYCLSHFGAWSRYTGTQPRHGPRARAMWFHRAERRVEACVRNGPGRRTRSTNTAKSISMSASGSRSGIGRRGKGSRTVQRYSSANGSLAPCATIAAVENLVDVGIHPRKLSRHVRPPEQRVSRRRRIWPGVPPGNRLWELDLLHSNHPRALATDLSRIGSGEREVWRPGIVHPAHPSEKAPMN